MFFLGFLVGLPGLALATGQVRHIADAQAFSKARGAQSIYVEVHASTWKTRGVLYWDVEGSLLVKLRDAGFELVRNQTDPHALTLTGEYVERKGKAFAVNRFGTVIEGTFRISHQTEGPLFDIHILETSEPTVTGTPPYLDVLHNFLTNPYYHYLGEMVWGEIQGSQDPYGILLDSLAVDVQRYEEVEEGESVMAHSWRSQHSMLLDKKLYAPVAVRRTIDDLVHAKEARLVGILKAMQHYPDVNVQVRSVEAFGEFGVIEAIPFLENLSQHSQQVEVRSAARSTIKVLSSIAQ